MSENGEPVSFSIAYALTSVCWVGLWFIQPFVNQLLSMCIIAVLSFWSTAIVPNVIWCTYIVFGIAERKLINFWMLRVILFIPFACLACIRLFSAFLPACLSSSHNIPWHSLRWNHVSFPALLACFFFFFSFLPFLSPPPSLPIPFPSHPFSSLPFLCLSQAHSFLTQGFCTFSFFCKEFFPQLLVRAVSCMCLSSKCHLLQGAFFIPLSKVSFYQLSLSNTIFLYCLHLQFLLFVLCLCCPHLSGSGTLFSFVTCHIFST